MSDQDPDRDTPPETTENHMKTTGNHTETTERRAGAHTDRGGEIHNQGNLERDIARYGNDKECRLLTIKGLGYRSPAYRETKQLVAENRGRSGRRRALISYGAADDPTRRRLGRDRSGHGNQIPIGPPCRSGGAH